MPSTDGRMTARDEDRFMASVLPVLWASPRARAAVPVAGLPMKTPDLENMSERQLANLAATLVYIMLGRRALAALLSYRAKDGG